MRTIQRCFVTSIQHVIRRKLILNWKKYTDGCVPTNYPNKAQRIVAYPELKINNFILDRVTEFNVLGLIISSNMKWKKTYRSYSTKSFQNHWYNDNDNDNE